MINDEAMVKNLKSVHFLSENTIEPTFLNVIKLLDLLYYVENATVWDDCILMRKRERKFYF